MHKITDRVHIQIEDIAADTQRGHEVGREENIKIGTVAYM